MEKSERRCGTGGRVQDHAAASGASQALKPTSELAAELTRREVAPSSLADMLTGCLGKSSSARAFESRCARAWHEVNGQIERRATSAVFLDKFQRAGAPPVLCVYVDSRLRAIDFRANREIYLARLAQAGLVFADIKFLVSKRPAPQEEDSGRASARGASAAGGSSRPKEHLPELTPAEAAQIEELTSTLPEDLRQSVSRAMSAAYRRARAQQSGNGE